MKMLAGWLIWALLAGLGFAQQPQAQSGQPIYKVNAAYVNGAGPGFWPTAGAGLTLNLSAGTAFCGTPPVAVNYAGGTLTMTASQTNYVYLDPAASCAPASNITGFVAGYVPLAKVITSGSAITSITDVRDWFLPQPCAVSGTGMTQCSSPTASQPVVIGGSGTGPVVAANTGGGFYTDSAGGSQIGVRFVDDPRNPILGGGQVIEESDLLIGNTLWKLYRKDATGNIYAATATIDSTNWFGNWSAANGGNPVSGMTGYYPNIFKVGSTYYCTLTDLAGPTITGPVSLYLYSSPDLINWTVGNSGNPVATHSAVTTDWNYTYFNSADLVVGTTWHLLAEGDTNAVVGSLGYGKTTWNGATGPYSFTMTKIRDVVAGSNSLVNPATLYVPDRNAVEVLVADYAASALPLRLRAIYGSLAADLTVPTNWTDAPNFEMSRGGVHLSDPYIVDLSSNGYAHKLFLGYNYAQAMGYQAWSDMTADQFYDATTQASVLSLPVKAVSISTPSFNVFRSDAINTTIRATDTDVYLSNYSGANNKVHVLGIGGLSVENGPAQVSTDNCMYFDFNVSNLYCIKKSSTTLLFKTGGDYGFPDGNLSIKAGNKLYFNYGVDNLTWMGLIPAPTSQLALTSPSGIQIQNPNNNDVGLSLVNTGTSGYGSSLGITVNPGGLQYTASKLYSENTAGNGGFLGFQTANTSQVLVDRVRIDQSGNVGIGTTIPSALLSVGTSSQFQVSSSGALSTSGTITPSQTNGIVGTTTNNNANAGSIGEYISSTVATGASVALSTGATANITSISLTAGDWDVTGACDFTFGATTSYTNLECGSSTTSATIGAQDSFFDFETPGQVPTAAKDMSWAIPTVRYSLAATTAVYLVAQATFTVSTLNAYGTIRARRVR